MSTHYPFGSINPTTKPVFTPADDWEEIVNLFKDAVETGKEIDLYHGNYNRDALYNKDQLFAVFSNKDIETMTEVLQRGIKS